jgi:hypothetical protein
MSINVAIAYGTGARTFCLVPFRQIHCHRFSGTFACTIVQSECFALLQID